jgi:hypothetical protein
VDGQPGDSPHVAAGRSEHGEVLAVEFHAQYKAPAAP